MPIGYVAKGSKEDVRVGYTDRAGIITDLSTSGPVFDVLDSADTVKVSNASASAVGMIITIPLDTTVGGVWAEGEYRLFVEFTIGGGIVRKGPYYFTIIE